MNRNFLFAWPLAWLILTFLISLDLSAELMGQPWVAGVIFFGTWGVLEVFSQKIKPHQATYIPSPKPATGQKKVLNLKDYRAQERQVEPGWVSVYRSEDPAMVGMVQSILVSREIKTQIINLHAASFFPNIEGMGMEICVSSEQSTQALKILKDHRLIPLA